MQKSFLASELSDCVPSSKTDRAGARSSAASAAPRGLKRQFIL